jgi:hypothetical protein
LIPFLLVSLPGSGFFAQAEGRPPVSAERWYVSNAGGMALESAPSRFAALRNEYSLMVGRVALRELPELLREYYQDPWEIEVRILYTEGAESRRQWIFLDGGVTRLTAVFVEPPPPDGEDTPLEALQGEEGGEAETEAILTGFIELYDGEGLLTEEKRFQDDGGELGIRYFYNRRILIRAETTLKSSPDSGAEDPAAEPEEAAELEDAAGPGEGAAGAAVPARPPVNSLPVVQLVCTDYYRYGRSGSLRVIERVYHEPVAGALVRFPHRSLDSIYDKDFVNPALTYGSESLSDIFADPVYRVVYNTDPRGRILSETRLDREGQVLGELSNTWAGDRLTQVVWKSGEDERRVEYRYNDDGDRIEERNYQNGNLERVVLREGDIEVEELYMDGQPILRARWENGRKISEERIRSSGSGRVP